MIRSVLAVLLGTVVGLVLACSRPESAPSFPMVSEGAGLSESSAWVYTPVPTATPWPTFTLAPTQTPTPTLMPTATPRPTNTSAPTAPPTPTLESVAFTLSPTGQPALVQELLPTPYGKLWNGPAYFDRQSVFPLQVSEPPGFLMEGDLERLPEPSKVISRTTRYILWVVAYDMSDAPEDYTLDGRVRWLDVTPGLDPLLMMENEVRLSKTESFFFSGMGRDTPGFWTPGVYRTELLDDRLETVLGWTFEVK